MVIFAIKINNKIVNNDYAGTSLSERRALFRFDFNAIFLDNDRGSIPKIRKSTEPLCNYDRK